MRIPILRFLGPRDEPPLLAFSAIAAVDAVIVVLASNLILKDAGSLALGIGLALRTVGVLAATILGGALADRGGHRRLLLFLAHVVIASFVLVGPAYAVSTTVGAATLGCLGFAYGLALPAMNTAVAISADGAERSRAISRWHTYLLTVQTVGPAVAGLLLVGLSARQTLLVAGAAIYAVGIPALMRWRPRTDAAAPADPQTTLSELVRAGLVTIAGTGWLRMSVVVSTLQVLFPVAAWVTLLGVLGNTRWAPTAQGTILAAFTLGGFIAIRLFGASPPRRPLVGIFAVQGVIAAGLLGIALVGSSWWLLVGIAPVVGGFVRLGQTWMDVSIAANVPDDLIGRVGSAALLATSTAMPIEMSLVGFLVSVVQPSTVAAAAAAWSVAVTLIGLASRHARGMRLHLTASA